MANTSVERKRNYTRLDAINAHDLYWRRMGDEGSRSGARFLASCDVLVHFLGEPWLRTHVLGGKGASPFLRADAAERDDENTPMDSHRWRIRVHHLADLLINFQRIEGFHEQIQRLAKDELEAGMAELTAAEMLYCSDIEFRFVVEKGALGCDYDLVATLAPTDVACEVKCKVEGTTMTESTIYAALNKAREQLPKDLPSIVFLKLPEDWSGEERALGETYLAAIGRFFRSSGRVSAVIGRSETWNWLPNDGVACSFWHRTDHNPRARFPLVEFGRIVAQHKNLSRWQSIDIWLRGISRMKMID